MDGCSQHCTGGSDQNHPQEKEMHKDKWLSEELLQIAETRREVKGKGEKERYTQMNAESQKTVRRDRKAFFSEKCKEIDKNNRMGKTRTLFKRIGDTKGTFHAKMGSIKDRNGNDITETEDIKKRQEYIVQFSRSVVSDSATPWTSALQASLSIANSQSLTNSCPLSR